MSGIRLGLVIFTAFLIRSSSSSCSQEDDEGDLRRSPIVQTKYGPVLGVVHPKGYYEFKGIPFAKAPVGELRFKTPQEPKPWTDPLDVVSFPEFCIQYNVFRGAPEGEEDCLYLSVFTPTLPKQDQDSKAKVGLPVMVYIHAGGFMFGRARFSGDYLMEHKNVLLVVIQYRLGSLGFLSTGDSAISQNNGMKDQVQALKFIQENIANFGGDPGRVFIFGTSAGGASVHYHIISPMSKGLFHTALSASGSALNPWAFQPDPISNSKKLAEMHGCPTEPSSKLVECLRSKPAHEIAFSHSKFLDFYMDPIAAFGPSVERGNMDDSTNFLPDTPINLIVNGEVNEVPWIVGFDTDEGYEHTLGITKDPEGHLEKLNMDWERIFPLTLEYVNESPELQKEISKKVRDFYFDNQPISSDNPKNLSNAYSDKTFIHGIIEAARAHAKLNKHPIYLFNFGYEGAHSIVTLRGHPREGFVANHMDDIQYLLFNTFLFPRVEEKDRPFQQKYLKMITTFVATGKIPAFDKDLPDDLWEPLQRDGQIKYYHITDNPEMKPISEELKRRHEFWNKFPLREYQVTPTSSQKSLDKKDEL